jgi:hypothetical protein
VPTILDAATRADLSARLSRLAPDARPVWGKFTAPRMVCHVSDALRMALGDLPVAPKRLPLRYPVIKQLVIYLFPFPRGTPTAPELLARLPQEWNGEVQSLRDELQKFSTRTPDEHWPDHPAFGSMSGRAWGVLAYRHMDHHFRQFGI